MREPLNKDAPFFRRREVQRKAAAEKGHDHNEDRLFAHAKDRLAAANAAIGTTRTFFFALLSIAAYIGVVVWSTTDEQLLRITPVTLPIIGVEVPLTDFYLFVPWLFVLLHFNLLIHLGLTSKKLQRFLDEVKSLDADLSSRLRNDVANFPLAQWLAGENEPAVQALFSFLAWLSLILIPPLLLIWLQIRLLPFQNVIFTWLQAVAVVLDALLILAFRNWFYRNITPPMISIRSWTQSTALKPHEQADKVRSALALHKGTAFFSIFASVCMALFLTLLTSFGRLSADGAIIEAGSAWKPFVRHLLIRAFALDLRELILVQNDPGASTINSLRAPESKGPEEIQLEVLGLELAERHLQGARFRRAVLPNVNMRRADLRGSSFYEALLQHADLSLANLERANLTGAKLHGLMLHGADLRQAELYRSDLRGAVGMRADLGDAYLHKANLSDANFSTPMTLVVSTGVPGAPDSGFSGWVFDDSQVPDTDRWGRTRGYRPFVKRTLAMVTDSPHFFLSRRTSFAGAELTGADFRWTNLTGADLSFANLAGVKNLDTAELAGADYAFADGLEGTILDINQPPPDVLPAVR